MQKQLSESLEDYIEAIAILNKKNGHAHTKEIAEHLGVKMPSVTSALRQLAQMGLIHYSTHFPVCLTEDGEKIAEAVMRRHNTLLRFFSETLALPTSKATEMACRIEHIVDEDTITCIQAFTDVIGKGNDDQNLKNHLSEALKCVEQRKENEHRNVFELNFGETAVITSFSENPLLTQVTSLKTGAVVRLLEKDADNYCILLVEERQVMIPAVLAESIIVKKVQKDEESNTSEKG